jgi:hypothetical protein
MSEEQFNEETEVEAHGLDSHRFSANDEARDEADDEVEAHGKQHLSKPQPTS